MCVLRIFEGITAKFNMGVVLYLTIWMCSFDDILYSFSFQRNSKDTLKHDFITQRAGWAMLLCSKRMLLKVLRCFFECWDDLRLKDFQCPKTCIKKWYGNQMLSSSVEIDFFILHVSLGITRFTSPECGRNLMVFNPFDSRNYEVLICTNRYKLLICPCF